MTTPTEYKVLAIGASMTALGLATRYPDDVIIVESKATPAPEFTGAFGGNEVGEPAARTDAGRALQKELETRGIIREGRCYLPALGAVYCKFLLGHRLRYLFWTDILEIRRHVANYVVTLFNASGRQQIAVERIVDTSPDPAGTPPGQNHRWTGKELRALAHKSAESDAGARDIETQGDIIWQASCFNSENIFGVRLAPETGWPEARTKLLAAWRARPSSLTAMRLAALATDFHYICPKGPFNIGQNWIHMPAAAYPNPLAAFEAGLEGLQ